jgi:hypothetical protein
MIYGGIIPAWKGLVGQFDYFADPSPDSPNVMAAKLSMDYLLPQTRYYGEGFGYPAQVDGIGAEICSLVRQGQLTAAEAVQQYQERAEAQYQQYLEDVKNVSG